MKAHLLVQGLAQGTLLCFPDCMPTDGDALTARWRRLATVIAAAHKFEAHFNGILDDENLHQSAVDLWRAGVLSMPFPRSYFEITADIPGQKEQQRHGIIVETTRAPNATTIHSFHFQHGAWVDANVRIFTDYLAPRPEGLEPYGDRDTDYPGWVSDNALRDLQHVIDLSCVMSTKHARVTPSNLDRLNQSRQRRGDLPLFDYHEITIDSAGVRAVCGAAGTHASPRMHWRRGHVRRVGERPIPVKPCLVGLAERGFIDKDYAIAHRLGQ